MTTDQEPRATVERFDPISRSGSLLLDDGSRLVFDGQALEGTGLRLLRTGQRVRVKLVAGIEVPVVSRVQILTLP